MGRHYNRTKRKDHAYLVGNQHAKRGLQKEDAVPESGSTDDKLAQEYGVSHMTIERAGKFAAAVEKLKDVDPERRVRISPLDTHDPAPHTSDVLRAHRRAARHSGAATRPSSA